MTVKVQVLCSTCLFCGNASVVEMPFEAYEKWKAGEFVQVAWPEADAPTRELLVSGIHPQCWEDNLMPSDEWEGEYKE